MSNFFRWLADVGPTLGRRSKSRWADVGSHRRADGCADVGPTLARRQHAIWVGSSILHSHQLTPKIEEGHASFMALEL